MSLAETADVVIAGGGVIGVSLACYLARRKFGRIVLLERDTLGSGSTGRSVASLDLFSHQPAAITLQVRAYEIFAHFAELFGEECGLVTTGFAVLAGPEHAAGLRKAALLTAAAGVDMQLLSPAGFADLEPGAATADLALICHVPAGGYADPMVTLHALAGAARRAGVIIQQGRTMTGLQVENDQVTGVETNAGPIAAPIVVSAAGPWSGRLFKGFGLDDMGLFAGRHPVMAMQRPANFERPHLSILDLPQQIYARPEIGPVTLAGSIDPAMGYDPVEPEDDNGRVPEDYTLWVAERLVQRYPALEAGRLQRGWSGLMTISPDWQPVLGALPGVSGLYCATGFSGQGFKISPAVGDLMAGLIAGEAEAAKLLAPFRPSRFAEGQPLTANEFGALG